MKYEVEMEEYNCNKCKIILKIQELKKYLHKCEACEKLFCRSCDDRTEILMWRESGDIEVPEKYLCEDCFSTSK